MRPADIQAASPEPTAIATVKIANNKVPTSSVPLSAFLAVLLVAVTAYHSYLGTNVVVEDYVHAHAAKLFLVLLLRFVYALVAGAAAFAILRIAFAP